MKNFKKITLGLLGATILSLGLYACSNDDGTTTDISTTEQTIAGKEIKLKKLSKEFKDGYVILTDLDLITQNVETIEAEDDLSTKRLGSGNIRRVIDEKLQLHKLEISQNIYESLLIEGLDDNKIVVLMTPGEYLEGLDKCADKPTWVGVALCTAALTAQVIMDCVNATPETESIHCW